MVHTPEAKGGRCCDCPGAVCTAKTEAATPQQETTAPTETAAAATKREATALYEKNKEEKAIAPVPTMDELQAAMDELQGAINGDGSPQQRRNTRLQSLADPAPPAAPPEPDTTVFFNAYVPKASSESATAIIFEQMSALATGPGWGRVSSVEYVTIGNASHLDCDRCNHAGHFEEGDERVTLNRLFEYCKAQAPPGGKSTNKLVAYVHDKGSYHYTPKNERLRRMLMHAVSSCIADEDQSGRPNKLRSNQADVCSARFSPVPHFHSSGNMWVARCDYVAKLLGPQTFSQHMELVHPNITGNPAIVRPSTGKWGRDLAVKDYEACFALGRFSLEHWVHSHPKVRPCDVYPGDFKWQYHNMPLLDTWNSGKRPRPEPGPKCPADRRSTDPTPTSLSQTRHLLRGSHMRAI